MLTNKDRKAIEEWKQLCARISASSSNVPINESDQEKTNRIKRLVDNFDEFVYYYFESWIDSKLGWFHIEGQEAFFYGKQEKTVWEFPREHAKSVVGGIFVPLHMKAYAQFYNQPQMYTGVLTCSATESSAKKLLSGLQAELESNHKYANDFGEQRGAGTWTDGHFVDAQGNGYWALGLGQSPRGVRESAKRPSIGIADDLDTDEMVRNEKRVNDAVDWLEGAFLGCLQLKEWRFLVLGNRIHPKSILAHVVGDLEEGDPINEGVNHIKVYATQGPNREYVGVMEGVPAWERYTMEDLGAMMKAMKRLARREYYHQTVKKEYTFKNEHFQYQDLTGMDFDVLVAYTDPSRKNTAKSDFKAIPAVGFKDNRIYLTDIFCAKCTPSRMAKAQYDMEERLQKKHPRNKSKHFIEGNFGQDEYLRYYEKERIKRGWKLRIIADKEPKKDKQGRIESLEPYFVDGDVIFCSTLKSSKHFREFLNQLTDFPFGEHDDGPDAFEGAVSKGEKKQKSSKVKPRMGKTMRGERKNNDYRRH